LHYQIQPLFLLNSISIAVTIFMPVISLRIKVFYANDKIRRAIFIVSELISVCILTTI
jgi:hypothetical protein